MQLLEEGTSLGEKFLIPTSSSFSEIPLSFHILMDNVYYEINVEKEDD